MIRRIHYSWLICFGCALVLFCTGGLCFTGFSVYLPYMKSMLGFTNTQVSVLLFARSLLGVIGMTFVNRFLKKYEIRRVVTVALIMAAASFFIYAACTTYAGCLAAVQRSQRTGSRSLHGFDRCIHIHCIAFDHVDR